MSDVSHQLVGDNQKICRKCGKPKPITDFIPSSDLCWMCHENEETTNKDGGAMT